MLSAPSFAKQQLVPRLNPVAALSSAAAGLLTGQDAYSGGDHITPERARLLHRLKFYGLVEKRVAGDGNCQVTVLFFCVRVRFVRYACLASASAIRGG